MATAKDSQPPKEELKVSSEPSKVIPKLATKVAVARAETSGNVILSFIANLPGEQAHLIERIVLDSETAKELVGLLSNNKEERDE